MLNKIIILILVLITPVYADVTGVRRVFDLNRNTTPNVLDVTYCGDVSDTSQSAAGTGKKCRVSDLFKAADITVDGANTGVGTTAPTAKLDVVGNIKLSGSIDTTLPDGECVQVTTNGVLTTSGAACGTGSVGGSVSDAAYSGSWDGDTTVAPSKNAVYDKIETLSSSGSGTVNTGNGGYLTYYPTTGTTVDDQAVIYTNGTNIGINSTSPVARLDVNGSGNNYLGTNVGIGSLNPGTALDVTGTARATLFSGPLTGNVTGNVTGNSSTATALAANGTNCSPGQYARGVDASGNAESCTSSGTGSPGGTTLQLQYNNASSFDGVVGSGVDSNGNIGIGSVNPTTPLDVNGVVKASSFQASSSVAGVLQLFEKASNGSNYVNWVAPDLLAANVQWILPIAQGTAGQLLSLQSASTGQLNWSDPSAGGGSGGWTDGGTTVYTTTNTDNVGIGTFVGNALLDISSTAAQDLLRINDNGKGDTTPFIINSTGNVGIGTTVNGGGLVEIRGTLNIRGTSPVAWSDDGNMQIAPSASTSASMRFITGGTERMRLGSGNLSIGTTSAVAKLVVMGNVGIGTTAGDVYLMTTPPTGGLIVYGNVGIGTVSPTRKLEVVGGDIKGDNYYSGDGTQGITQTCGGVSITGFTVKDGLITSCSGT